MLSIKFMKKKRKKIRFAMDIDFYSILKYTSLSSKKILRKYDENNNFNVAKYCQNLSDEVENHCL